MSTRMERDVVKEKEFRWLGRLLIPGIFDGEHIFEIKDNGDRATTFVHREIFRGILVPVLWNKLAQDTENGFVSMNESLKLRAEEI
jgi:hypothetical protein